MLSKGGAAAALEGGSQVGGDHLGRPIGITDTPGGLKLQAEGHDVRYRNAWIKELNLERPNTDFKR
jgi:hypothetical protein